MADVSITNCRLQIVRRGGWSWGLGRRELTERAVNRLPELIVQRLANLFPDESDVELTEPVRVQVRMTMHEFANLTERRAGREPLQDVPTHIFNQIDGALRQAASTAAANRAPQTREETFSGRSNATVDEVGTAPHGPPLLRLLIDQHRTGRLPVFLRSLSHQVLSLWHSALLQVNARPQSVTDTGVIQSARKSKARENISPPAVTPREIDEVVGRVARFVEFESSDVSTIVRTRIVAVLEALTTLDIAPSDPQLADALAAYLPIDDLARSPDVTENPKDSQRPESARRQISGKGDRDLRSGSTIAAAYAKPPPSISAAEIQIQSALPFLLLGPLSKIGFLDTVAAALEAAELTQFSGAVGAALAYKVLEPPTRGWMRSPASQRAAATFAGISEPPSEAWLNELVPHADDFVSALETVVGRAVIDGHDREHPFLLTRFQHHGTEPSLIVDLDGLFPAWKLNNLGELPKVLADRDSSMLVLDGRTVTPSLLKQLHNGGYRFLIDVPPTRNETWRTIKARDGGRWWTNDALAPLPRLAQEGRRLAPAVESVSTIVHELLIRRPAVRRNEGRGLDCALTLAAAVALAQIAWTLWRDREPTDPLLALDRFADLGARVSFDASTVRVVLPLGRRSMDLENHRLLDDVANVPWLGERVVTFSKG